MSNSGLRIIIISKTKNKKAMNTHTHIHEYKRNNKDESCTHRKMKTKDDCQYVE
jgi:hypothetical protein